MIQKFLVVVIVLFTFSVNAQYAKQSLPLLRSSERIDLKPVNQPVSYLKLNTLWESTFDSPAEWAIDHDAADCSLNWKIGSDTCQGPFYIDTIQSTSAANGWAILDSDEYGALTGGSDIEDSWLTTAVPLDLTATPNVIIEFETFYRRYNYERPYLVVGVGDGFGNVVWPDLNPTSDISGMDNVFEIFPNWQDGQYSDNPHKVQINVSSALTGAINEIYFRINWTGRWGYALFIDDFKVLEQAQDDIVLKEAWVYNENTDNIQYAKTPIDQVEANWEIGAEVYNFGAQDQTNVLFEADFTAFTVSDNRALFEADSTYSMGNLEPLSLPVGLYEGVFSVVSDNETGGPEFGNNEQLRNFEVTDSLYAQDGIDVHPLSELTLSSIGTSTFEDADDGLVLAAMYHIKQQTLISGLRIMLAPGTIQGGVVVGSILDTADFWMNDIAPIMETEIEYVSSQAIVDGYVDVYFATPLMLDTGSYYAAVSLYSNDNVNQISVMNDLTVTQPAHASVVHHHGVSYTNGNALGIRMLMNEGWMNVTENVLDGIDVYPNPSDGHFTITNVTHSNNTIDVYAAYGTKVFSTRSDETLHLDLSDRDAGVYFIRISNAQGTATKKIVIN